MSKVSLKPEQNRQKKKKQKQKQKKRLVGCG
jgi:hypothetical protein